MKIVASIVSYNTKDLLRDCINGLLAQKSDHQIEAWVIDNASSDGSIEMLQKEFPNIKAIASHINHGFAKGHNMILKKADSDYFLVLNPDTILPKDAIAKMLQFMEDNPDCGIASPSIEDSNGQPQSTAGDFPVGLALIAWLFNLEKIGSLPNFHKSNIDIVRDNAVGWVTGACMVVDAKVFKQVGYFDEDYFMYFEDVDFCYRASKANFAIKIIPNLVIRHIGGASSANPQLRQWSGEMQGLILFYQKNYGNFSSRIVKLLSAIAIILRIIAFGLMGKFFISKTYIKVLAKL